MRLTWQVPPETWQRVIAQSDQATLFHTPAWAAVVAATQDQQVVPLYARFEDGREALATVFTRPIWGGLLVAARNGAGGGYGGLVATGPLSSLEQQAIYDALRARFPECGGVSNPFGEPPPTPSSLPWREAPPTHVLQVQPLDQIRLHYDPSRKRAVRRYQAAGVHLHMVPRPGEEEKRLLMRLYHRQAEVWRQRSQNVDHIRPNAWFDHLWRHMGGQMRMAIATIQGEVVGAELLLTQGIVATELIAVRDPRFASCQIATALIERCLIDCRERGVRYMDAMPSGNLEGVRLFKESFGATHLPIWEFHHPSPLSQAIATIQLVWNKARPPALTLPLAKRLRVSRRD